MPRVSPEAPKEHGSRYPRQCRAQQHNPRVVNGHEPSDQVGEHEQSQASHRRPGSVHRGRFSAAVLSAQTEFFLSLAFVFFDQCRAGRKNSWESEKQSSDSWAVPLRNQACRRGDQSAKAESNQQLIPATLLQGRNVDLNPHLPQPDVPQPESNGAPKRKP